MILYRKTESGRYQEAGTGEILYAAMDELSRIGQREVAEWLGVKMLNALGYMPPAEVRIMMEHQGMIELPGGTKMEEP